MTKHVLDRPSNLPKALPAQAMRIARSFQPHPGTVALQRRARKRAFSLRTKYFLRFADGLRP